MEDKDKKPSFLEDISAETKPESFQEEVFYKTKKNYVPTIIFSVMGLSLFIALFVIFTKGAEVPDMAGWREGEIYTWAKNNNANVVKEDAWSLEVKDGVLISQSIPAGDKVKRNGTLEVVVSKGPDPVEKISFPDVKEMSLAAIQAWIDDNHLSGVSIKKEHSNVFEEGKVISVDFSDGDEDSFIRKNRVKIYVSLGEEDLKDTVSVPDFSGKTKSDVMKWANNNEIEVGFAESFNEYVDTGKIYDQNISGNTKMKRTDRLEITISLGKALYVPNFVGVTRDDAIEMAKVKSVQIHFKNEVSTKKEGTVIEQDIVAGETVSSEQIITVIVATASDSVVVPDLVGLSRSEASTLASLKNLNTFFVTKSSTEKADRVVEQSVAAGRTIEKETLVTISVSSGDISMPDLVGVKMDEAEILAEKLGLSMITRKEKSSEVKDGTIISQSQPVETIIESSDKVIITVASNNGVKVPDMSDMGAQEAKLWGQLNDTTVTVIEAYSDRIPVGTLYDQSYTNAYVPGDDPLIIYESLGKVAVKDFIGQNKLTLQDWIKEVNRNGADIRLETVGTSDTSQPVGTIVSQSTRLDFLDTGSKLTVYVAEANSTNSVPDFTNMVKHEIEDWCEENHVSYRIVDRYSDIYKYGTLFGQNYVGQSIPTGDTLILYKSIGKVMLPNFVGSSRSGLEKWVNEQNIKGANLTLDYSYEYVENKNKDTVVSQSTVSDHRTTDKTIEVTLASARSVTLRSYIGMPVSEAMAELRRLGIPYECQYIKLNADNAVIYPEETIFGQSQSNTFSFVEGDVLMLNVSDGTNDH